MEIDKKIIEIVAKNARLELNNSEKEKFSQDFKEIISYFSKLENMQLTDEKPSFHLPKLSPKYREDIPSQPLGRKALLLIKNKEDGYYKGPGV